MVQSRKGVQVIPMADGSVEICTGNECGVYLGKPGDGNLVGFKIGKEGKKPFWEWVKDFEKIVVAFSGGKDSQAMVACLLDHGIEKEKIIMMHNATPFDFPDLEKFCIDFARKVGIRMDLIGSGKSIEDNIAVARHYGMPRTGFQCTSIFKIIPSRAYLSQYNKYNTLVTMGWRREESEERAQAKMRYYNKDLKLNVAYPILKWPEKRVYDTIRKKGWELHSAYASRSRLACFNCYAMKRPEWEQVREKDPENFILALEFLAESTLSDYVTPDMVIYTLRKMFGLNTVKASRGEVRDRPEKFKARKEKWIYGIIKSVIPGQDEIEIKQMDGIKSSPLNQSLNEETRKMQNDNFEKSKKSKKKKRTKISLDEDLDKKEEVFDEEEEDARSEMGCL